MQEIENSVMHSTVNTSVGNAETYSDALKKLDVLIKKLTFGDLRQRLIECGYGH
jgi:hypothetical protein